MAVGTLGSRLTGFLRTIVQSAALGAFGIAVAYNLSNTLPNVVYNLALGGILTSVIVPLIVSAAKRDSDRDDGYDQRMFTLVTAALAGVTLRGDRGGRSDRAPVCRQQGRRSPARRCTWRSSLPCSSSRRSSSTASAR